MMEGNTFVISAQSEYPDIAFQLLLFLTLPEQIQRFVDAGESIPIHYGPKENAYFLNDPKRPKARTPPTSAAWTMRRLPWMRICTIRVFRRGS